MTNRRQRAGGRKPPGSSKHTCESHAKVVGSSAWLAIKLAEQAEERNKKLVAHDTTICIAHDATVWDCDPADAWIPISTPPVSEVDSTSEEDSTTEEVSSESDATTVEEPMIVQYFEPRTSKLDTAIDAPPKFFDEDEYFSKYRALAVAEDYEGLLRLMAEREEAYHQLRLSTEATTKYLTSLMEKIASSGNLPSVDNNDPIASKATIVLGVDNVTAETNSFDLGGTLEDERQVLSSQPPTRLKTYADCLKDPCIELHDDLETTGFGDIPEMYRHIDLTIKPLPPHVTWVDTKEKLEESMTELNAECSVSDTCNFFLDGEGSNKFNREGTLTSLQINVGSTGRTWIMDTVVLGKNVFWTAPKGGWSLKEILENPNIEKAFFDVRMDSDVLYGEYKVHMKNVMDEQLMEYGTKTGYDTHVRSLYLCMNDLLTSWRCSEDEFAEFQIAKWEGKVACLGPRKFDVHLDRPLDPKSMGYAAQDVQLMKKYYDWKLDQIKEDADPGLLHKIKEESARRVDMCLEPLEGRPKPWFGPESLRRGTPPA